MISQNLFAIPGTPPPFRRAIVEHGLRKPMTCNCSSTIIGDNEASSAAKE